MEQQPPQVSVIMPTRNCLAWLPAAVDSVLSQDHVALELIIVDDGSNDGSGEWLAAKAATDPRIILLKGQALGPSEARNLALAQAKADWVAFLDADDTWRPGKLSQQVAFHLAHPETVMSFTNYRHVGEAGDDRGDCFGYWPLFRQFCGRGTGYSFLSDAHSMLLAENVVGTSTVVACRHALHVANGFATDWPSAEDWDLWLRLARMGRVAFTPEIGADYLMRAGSLTTHAEARIAAVEGIIASHSGDSANWAKRHAIARLFTAKAEFARAHGAAWRAFHDHVAAFLRAPSKRAGRAALADLAAAIRHPFASA